MTTFMGRPYPAASAPARSTGRPGKIQGLSAGPQIREATAEDAERIWRVLEQVVRSGDTFPFDPEIGREEAMRTWTAAPAAVFVAVDGDELLGSYQLRPNQPGLGSHVANASFMVDPAARGRGTGRALAEHALDEARRRGYRAMQFNLVVADNEKAIALWRKLGFEEIGRVPGGFHQRRERYVDTLIMYRSLVE